MINNEQLPPTPQKKKKEGGGVVKWNGLGKDLRQNSENLTRFILNLQTWKVKILHNLKEQGPVTRKPKIKMSKGKYNGTQKIP